MANDIVDDVRLVRESNKDANIDISEIAKKYILIGTKKSVVESYLKERNFVLNNQPIAADKSQTLVAIYVENSLFANVGFHDEIRIIVVFENELVKSIGGKLIYRAL